MLILLDSRGEKIISDKTHTITTDKFVYSREPNGDWIQKDLPVVTIQIDPYPPLESVLPPKKTKKSKKLVES
jgi:hypothetical protein